MRSLNVLRIVIDTNIWIRCLLGGPVTRPVFEAWLAGRFQVLISEPLLAELEEVWQRPRLRKHISDEDAHDLLDKLRSSADHVEITTIPPQCRDPKDHPFLATAIDGKADAIVSGDADLRGDDGGAARTRRAHPRRRGALGRALRATRGTGPGAGRARPCSRSRQPQARSAGRRHGPGTAQGNPVQNS